MSETWCLIPGLLGLYEASSLGRVRSVHHAWQRPDRLCANQHGPYTRGLDTGKLFG